MIYEIYLDDKLLYYPDDELYRITNGKITEGLNKAGTLEFDVPAANPEYDNFHLRKSILTVLKDGVEIFAGEVREVSQNFDFTKHVYAVSELAYLFDSIQPQAVYRGRPSTMFAALVTIHNNQVDERKKFEIGSCTVIDPNDNVYHYTNYEDTLTAIRSKMAETLNGYLRVRKENGKRYLDLVTLNEYGKLSDQSIEFGRNMLDFSSNTDSKDIATDVIPLGAIIEEDKRTSAAVSGLDERVTIKSVNGGSDRLYNTTARDNFGVVTVVKEWDDVHEPSILKSKAQQWLQSAQFANLILDLDAFDLNNIDQSIDSYEVGDRVNAIAEPFGMNNIFTVQEKVTYLNELDKGRISLGDNKKSSYTDQASKAVEIVTEKIPEITPILEDGKARVAAIINGTENGTVVFEWNEDKTSIISISILDGATEELSLNMWKWNMGGFAFWSREDTTKPWSESTLGAAITMSGEIIGDYITAGTIDADKVNITNLNASNITAGTIDASQVEVKNLNASKITSGTMSASMIQGDTLKLGGQNNKYGQLKVFELTSSGFETVGVTIDNKGISGSDFHIDENGNGFFNLLITDKVQTHEIEEKGMDLTISSDQHVDIKAMSGLRIYSIYTGAYYQGYSGGFYDKDGNYFNVLNGLIIQ